ncbi:unnamed protein product [Calicophoron daubneyi]|uniref:GATA-type domain-containing protein n=1 Tax=Calicophoron daubneyi TaxID=300641 RepID=A0AAV2TEM7_CALDB
MLTMSCETQSRVASSGLLEYSETSRVNDSPVAPLQQLQAYSEQYLRQTEDHDKMISHNQLHRISQIPSATPGMDPTVGKFASGVSPDGSVGTFREFMCKRNLWSCPNEDPYFSNSGQIHQTSCDENSSATKLEAKSPTATTKQENVNQDTPVDEFNKEDVEFHSLAEDQLRARTTTSSSSISEELDNMLKSPGGQQEETDSEVDSENEVPIHPTYTPFKAALSDSSKVQLPRPPETGTKDLGNTADSLFQHENAEGGVWQASDEWSSSSYDRSWLQWNCYPGMRSMASDRAYIGCSGSVPVTYSAAAAMAAAYAYASHCNPIASVRRQLPDFAKVENRMEYSHCESQANEELSQMPSSSDCIDNFGNCPPKNTDVPNFHWRGDGWNTSWINSQAAEKFKLSVQCTQMSETAPTERDSSEFSLKGSDPFPFSFQCENQRDDKMQLFQKNSSEQLPPSRNSVEISEFGRDNHAPNDPAKLEENGCGGEQDSSVSSCHSLNNIQNWTKTDEHCGDTEVNMLADVINTVPSMPDPTHKASVGQVAQECVRCGQPVTSVWQPDGTGHYLCGDCVDPARLQRIHPPKPHPFQFEHSFPSPLALPTSSTGVEYSTPSKMPKSGISSPVGKVTNTATGTATFGGLNCRPLRSSLMKGFANRRPRTRPSSMRKDAIQTRKRKSKKRRDYSLAIAAAAAAGISPSAPSNPSPLTLPVQYPITSINATNLPPHMIPSVFRQRILGNSAVGNSLFSTTAPFQSFKRGRACFPFMSPEFRPDLGVEMSMWEKFQSLSGTHLNFGEAMRSPHLREEMVGYTADLTSGLFPQQCQQVSPNQCNQPTHLSEGRMSTSCIPLSFGNNTWESPAPLLTARNFYESSRTIIPPYSFPAVSHCGVLSPNSGPYNSELLNSGSGSRPVGDDGIQLPFSCFSRPGLENRRHESECQDVFGSDCDPHTKRSHSSSQQIVHPEENSLYSRIANEHYPPAILPTPSTIAPDSYPATYLERSLFGMVRNSDVTS